MLVLAGQHSGFTTKALANVTPLSTSRRVTSGMYDSVSQRWSSVRMNTMFGLRAWAEARRVAGTCHDASTRKTRSRGPLRRAVRADIIGPLYRARVGWGKDRKP